MATEISKATSESPAQEKLEGEAMKEALKKQLEYYFSKENLMVDRFLLAQMNSEMYVPIKVIAGFKLISALTSDYDAVVAALKSISIVSLDETSTLVRPNIKPHKNVIILREIPSTTPVEEIKELFNNEICGKKVTDIKADINNFWYVTFEDDDSALKALDYLREQKFQGQAIKARIKVENTFRSLYTSALASADPLSKEALTHVPQQYAENSDYAYNGYVQYDDGNYKGYDNKRGGYRKQGKTYPTRGGRGGYRGGKENNTNTTQTRKRRESGGSLQFTSQHFPPLPSQGGKPSGYDKDFKKYTKQELVDIISNLKVSDSVENISVVKVVLTEPNFELEVTKPWPVKHDVTHSNETKENNTQSDATSKSEVPKSS